MEKVVIIGGKSSAILLADYIYDAQHKHGMPIECIGFAYNDVPIGTDINGFSVISRVEDVYDKYKDDKKGKIYFSIL